MSLKDATLRTVHEHDCAFVDADDDATVDNNQYAANNGFGSLDVCRSLEDVSGVRWGGVWSCWQTARSRGTVDGVLLDCAKNCMKETRQCAGGAQVASESNNFYFKNIPCV